MEQVAYINEEAESTQSPLMTPEQSIFGDKGEYKTIQIQEIGPQYQETIQYNMFFNGQPSFQKLNPFRIYPNIVGNLVAGPTNNYFFDALFLAYTAHGELVLSPSDIWLAILAQFSEYVNDNSEELRNKIVTHQGKKDLVIYVNDTDPRFSNIKSNEFRWDLLTNQFSNLIKQNTLGDIQKIVECDFSCSSQIELVISQAALMHTCEKYFDYRVGVCGCGIQKVHFLGTRTDWENLQWKLQSLLKYKTANSTEFEKWISGLGYVITNFIQTYDGKPNINFWNSIVQEKKATGFKAGASGMTTKYEANIIDGWIINFFFKIKKKIFEWNGPQIKDQQKNTILGVELSDITAFQWKAPVLLEFQRTQSKLGVDFVGGFTGVLLNNNIYRPQVSFAVAERNITEREKKLPNLF